MYFLYILYLMCAARHAYPPIIMKCINDETFPCINFRTLLLFSDFLIFCTIHLHINYASRPNS